MARSLEQCCGPWRGFWIQFCHRGEMKLTLTFREAACFGMGEDPTGSFEISGTYDHRDRVNFTKTFDRMDVILRNTTPEVRYRGKWNGQFIAGTWWQVGYPDNTGAFEIWPEDEEQALAFNEALMARPEAIPAGRGLDASSAG